MRASGAEYLYGMFSWMRRLNLGGQLNGWLVEGLAGGALLGALRQTPQYQAMFPYIRRSDGTMRQTESDYLKTEEAYRKVHRQYGRRVPTSPWEFGAYYEGEIAPDELEERFQLWDYLDRNTQDERDAFYVYAGMSPSTSDLYQAVVDPGAYRGLVDEYNQRVAAQPLDYETWITRATEAGLSRVIRTLEDLQGANVVTGSAISTVRNVSPDFSRQMMDVLYHGGAPTEGPFLGLKQLMHAFEEAMIGSAATAQGLRLPSVEKVRLLRSAGVDRAKAMEKYGEYVGSENLLRSLVRRTGRTSEFGQSEYENATFLGGEQAFNLAQGKALEESFAQGSGAPPLAVKDEHLVQTGLRSPLR